MADKVQKIRNEVERLQNELIQEKKKGFGSDADDACILELQNVLTYIDSLQEEPVSKELEDTAINHAESLGYTSEDYEYKEIKDSFKTGAKWERNHIWHSSDEKPEENKDILFLRSEAFIHNSMRYTDCNFCNDAMRGCDKWCYIADLED